MAMEAATNGIFLQRTARYRRELRLASLKGNGSAAERAFARPRPRCGSRGTPAFPPPARSAALLPWMYKKAGFRRCCGSGVLVLGIVGRRIVGKARLPVCRVPVLGMSRSLGQHRINETSMRVKKRVQEEKGRSSLTFQRYLL